MCGQQLELVDTVAVSTMIHTCDNVVDKKVRETPRDRSDAINEEADVLRMNECVQLPMPAPKTGSRDDRVPWDRMILGYFVIYPNKAG
jgi:hypothetical protein